MDFDGPRKINLFELFIGKMDRNRLVQQITKFKSE